MRYRNILTYLLTHKVFASRNEFVFSFFLVFSRLGDVDRIAMSIILDNVLHEVFSLLTACKLEYTWDHNVNKYFVFNFLILIRTFYVLTICLRLTNVLLNYRLRQRKRFATSMVVADDNDRSVGWCVSTCTNTNGGFSLHC